MPKKWTIGERNQNYKLLYKLYKNENKTIREIGEMLGVSEKTIFKRLKILNIKTDKTQKSSYCNKRKTFIIPYKKSKELAEFFGIMLGDGSLSPNQIMVTLGSKENEYVLYVQKILQNIFQTYVNISIRKKGYCDVYISSVEISKWLKNEGLVYNKVKSQVDAPKWIFNNKSYCESFIRGFFDTDGSVYKLKYGIQIALTNKSAPLLISLQKMLITLEYRVSKVSSYKIYLTRQEDINRFFREIKPMNLKHLKRFESFK